MIHEDARRIAADAVAPWRICSGVKQEELWSCDEKGMGPLGKQVPKVARPAQGGATAFLRGLLVVERFFGQSTNN